MRRSRLPFILLLGLAGAGCTTQLETRPGLTAEALAETPLDGANGSLQFHSYAVPAAQFKVTVKSRAATCIDGKVDQTEIQATVETQYNPAQRFAVDYSALAAFTKTTNLTTTRFPNGTLKSINAEAADQTIETATAVMKLVGSIAAFAGAADPSKEDPRCVALRKREADKKTFTEAKTRADAAISALVAQNPDPNTAEANAKKLAGLQAIRDAIGAKLTALEVSGWETADTLWPADPTSPITLNKSEQLTVGKVSQLHVMLTRVDDPSTKTKAFEAPVSTGANFPGLIWRQGYRAKLVIGWCGNDLTEATPARLPFAGCSDSQVKGAELATTTAVVPQAGPFFVIPLKNGIGRNNSIAATFLADGSIETATYGDKAAVGKQIATAANELVTAAGALFPSQSSKLAARKACLDAVEALRKSETAVADLLGDEATPEAAFAAYAAKCME